jgi:hypothetical protein
MKKLLLLFVFLCNLSVQAQDVVFEASTPKSSYALNERIPLLFTIKNEGDNFEPPNLDSFDVNGPITTKGKTSIDVIINGKKMSKRVVQTQMIYYLKARKIGNFTINSATFEYEGKTFKSNPITIKVTEAVEEPIDPNSPDFKAGQGTFVVAEITKNNIYVNEPTTLVYKFYFDPSFRLRNYLETNTPKINGFWNQVVEIGDQRPVYATYNGKQYGMIVLKKVLLYPLENGNKVIDPLTLEIEVGVPFLQDFGIVQREVYRSVIKTLTTQVVNVSVKDLPENQLESFSGAVGKLSFKITPSKTQVKQGETINLEVVAQGTGNLKLFSLPKPIFPKSIEGFEPEHKEKVTILAEAMTGSISDVYTIIPQEKGKITIEPVAFSYFNIETKKYETLFSEPIVLDVLDNPNFTPNDKTIVQNNSEAQKKKNTFQFIEQQTSFKALAKKDFFESALFYILLLVPIIFIPIIVLVRKKKQAIDADFVGNKIKRNTRLARKYLADAKKQLGNKVPFYLAMEKALHNFLKAKLRIETSEMSKENIEELLLQKNAQTETVASFIALMNNCEYARYAPATDVAMQADYENAVNLISELQKQL